VNKQQALEAILRKVRGWEEAFAEVRAVHPDLVFGQLRNQVLSMTPSLGTRPYTKNQEALLITAAAALYLMVDEVTVVEGRRLEEWLASSEDTRLAEWARGEARVVVEVVPPVPPLPQGDEEVEAVG
jgi:hypothetical protein